jgi:pyridoxal phosphate enzyme (YggS family)
MTDIAENLTEIRSQLPNSVLLVAVSKTKPIEVLEDAYQAGQRVFGENRIQEMAEKYEQLPKDIEWHMIGHVQGNKIKYMAPFVHMVHGMDKPKRLNELNKEAAKNDRVINCLIQIHIAEEESKFGFSYEEASNFLNQNLEEKYPNLNVRGLMGMATNTGDKEKIRSEFRSLNQFFERMKGNQALSGFDTLSMGMSGDFLIAIEEGANLVRIGSSIFGERNK